MAHIQEVLRTAWRLLREASGEDDYRRYCTYVFARGDEPLSADEFYLQKLRQKYSQASRCC